MNILRNVRARARSVLAGVLMASFAISVPAGAADAATWRFATLLAPENPVSRMLRSAAEEIEAETDGRVRFQIAYGGESGLNPRQFLDVVKAGVIEGVVISSSSVGFDYPWLGVYNVPFLAPDVSLRRTIFEATEPMMDEFLAEQGVVPLAYPLYAPRWSVMYLA